MSPDWGNSSYHSLNLKVDKWHWLADAQAPEQPTATVPAYRAGMRFEWLHYACDRPGSVVAIIRPGKVRLPWVSISKDNGMTWSEARPANFPIGISKMYAGTLSTRQRYLVATSRRLVSRTVTRW